MHLAPAEAIAPSQDREMMHFKTFWTAVFICVGKCTWKLKMKLFLTVVKQTKTWKSMFKEELFWFFAAPYTAAPETRTWEFFPSWQCNSGRKYQQTFCSSEKLGFKYMLSISDSEQRTCCRSRKQYPNVASQNSASQKSPTVTSIQITVVPEDIIHTWDFSANTNKFLFSTVMLIPVWVPHVRVSYLNTGSRKKDYSFPEFMHELYIIKIQRSNKLTLLVGNLQFFWKTKGQ